MIEDTITFLVSNTKLLGKYFFILFLIIYK